MTIHHTIVKKAAKLGATLVERPEGDFALLNVESGQQSVEAWDSASEAVEELAKGHVEWAKLRRLASGVMAMGYHDRYESNPHGPGCNDDLDCALRDALVSNEGIDLVQLEAICTDAGVWNPDWKRLNPGMQRMNGANRLRGLLRNSQEARIVIGGKEGRFGVAFQPAARRAKKKAA